MALEEVSVWKGEEWKKEKNPMQMLKDNLASRNGVKSRGKKKGGEYFVIEAGQRFPHKHWANVFPKDIEQRQTLAYKDTGMTKDGRWDKQIIKKKDNAFL